MGNYLEDPNGPTLLERVEALEKWRESLEQWGKDKVSAASEEQKDSAEPEPRRGKGQRYG